MKKWGTLIALSMAMFIIVIDTTIMNVSISALIVDLNTTVSGVQAAISIYALVMAAFILIGGKLADIFGPKRVFIVGLFIYSIGTTVASFSNSLGTLILGWSILEGLGASLMIPNIQVLLRNRYEGAELALSYSIIGAVGAVGAALGPIVGGFFTTYISWRWAFRTELVVAVLVFIFSRYIMADKLGGEKPRFDFVGAGLSVFGWSSIVLGILLSQTYGIFLAKEPFVIGNWEIAPFGLSITPILVGIGVLLIILLLRWEHRLETQGGDGLFRPSILKIPGITPGILIRFLQMGAMAGFLYVFPLLLQLSFEFTAMQTGLALMPFSISVLILALVGARLSSRFYANRLIQIGFVISAAGLGFLAASITPDATPSELALGAIFGAGIGLVASQILNLIYSSVDEDKAPETAGLTATFEQLGNAIGVALIGTVMIAVLTATTISGIEASAVIPPDAQPAVIAAVEESVELMSDTQLAAGLEAAGVSEAGSAELQAIYGVARTEAFRASIALLIFATLLALVIALWLPKRKLVEAQT